MSATELANATTRPAAMASDSVAAAMKAVLATELEAAQSLEQCEAQCNAALESARVDALAIATRAESIARAIHGRIEQVASDRAERHRREITPHDLGAGDAGLDAAVQRLAASLTGGTP